MVNHKPVLKFTRAALPRFRIARVHDDNYTSQAFKGKSVALCGFKFREAPFCSVSRDSQAEVSTTHRMHVLKSKPLMTFKVTQ